MATNPITSQSPLWRWTLGLAFLAVALLTIRPVRGVDLGFHLRAGEWMAQHWTLPEAAVFSLEPGEARYVDPSWLYQLAVYALHCAGGWDLFSLAHSAVLVAMLAITFLRCLRGAAPPLVCAVVFFAVGGILELRFIARPEILGLALLAAMLTVLEAWRDQGRNRLWLLPVAQVLWVNTHGTFVYGLLVMLAFGLGDALRTRRMDRTLWKWIGLGCAATFLTPYGWSGVALPFSLLARFGDEPIFRESIPELWSPWHTNPGTGSLALTHTRGVSYYGFTLLTPLLMLLRRKGTRVEEWIVVAVFGVVAAGSVRMVPLFVVACAPWLVRSLGALRAEWPRWLECRTAAWVGIALFGLQCVRVAAGADYGWRVMQTRFGLGWEPRMAAATGSDFLATHHLDGTLLEDAQTGSWLVWARQRPVHFHGNMEILGAARFREFWKSLEPGGLAPLLAQHRPDLVTFELAMSFGWLVQLEQLGGWRPIFLDDTVAVYARDGYAPHLPRVGFTTWLDAKRVARLTPAQRYRLLFKTPEPWWERFFLPRPFAHELSAADRAFAMGDRLAAERLYLRCFETHACNDGERGVLINLANIYDTLGDAPKALLCYTRLLEMDPADAKARDLLERIAAAEARGRRAP